MDKGYIASSGSGGVCPWDPAGAGCMGLWQENSELRNREHKCVGGSCWKRAPSVKFAAIGR